jgi:hypothetical protein
MVMPDTTPNAKDFDPKHIGIHPLAVSRGVKAQFEEQQHPSKCDGNGWKQNMKRNIRTKLHTGKDQGIHGVPL